MKVKELKKLIEEAYIQVLREAEEPSPEDPVGDEKASEETCSNACDSCTTHRI